MEKYKAKNGSKSSPLEFNKRRAYGFDETGPWNGNGHKILRFLYYSSLINKDSSLMLRETTGGLPDLFLLLTHGLGVSSGQCVGTYGRDDVGSVSCGWLHDGSVIIGAMADRRIYLWSLYGTEIEHELEQKQREQNNNKIQQF